jgi:hypothetical protein
MAEVMALVLRSHLARVWTSLPGLVETYDPATQKVSVRPAIADRYETADGEDMVELPVIPGVPVVFPSGGGYVAALPLAKGDPVLLVFSSRSTDVWRAGDGTSQVDPNDLRTHDLSDAFAIPGGRPFGAPLKDCSATDLVIGKGDGSGPLLTLKADGSILIGRNAAAAAARVGDAVQVTVPIGTFLTAAQAGVLNAAPVTLDGQITAGSSKVKVE